MIYEEGMVCPHCEEGTMEFGRVENCSCHISPPCHACVNQLLTCNVCGAEEVPGED